MRPMPITPSVAPWMSPPRKLSNDHLRHWPARSQCSDSAMRRAVAIIRAQPKSAVVSLSTSGVLVPSTFAALKAAMSKLL